MNILTLENIAVAFGLVSVYLSTREKIWSWPTGIVNVLLFAVLFRRERLYADMGLQIVYFVLSVYGWYEWLYGGAHRTELRVSRLRPSLVGSLGLLGVVCSVALGTLLQRTTDASNPYLDSTLSVFSLIAQWMMTRKILENWTLWIVVDVCYVFMFVFLKHLDATAFQYAVFLLLAAFGHVQWLRSWRADRVAVASAT